MPLAMKALQNMTAMVSFTERQRETNRTKSRVRAKVEQVFFVIKREFGFTKVRYRGLDKNAHRLFVVSALANLFIVRKPLLRLARG
jgi:transposase, IS5 family